MTKTNSLPALQAKLDQSIADYARCQGNQLAHYNRHLHIQRIKAQIQDMTAPRMVIDYDGTVEPRLMAEKVQFTMDFLPVPTTDKRELAAWVAAIYIGEVGHA